MASSALPETLKSVTATKIVELKKQRDLYESSKSKIVNATKKQSNYTSKTQALLDGSCGLEGVRVLEDSASEDENDHSSASAKAPKLENQQLLLRQAKVDPSFPRSVVEKIQKDLVRDLELKSVQHEHAQFFSELVTEWISNPDDQRAQPPTENVTASTDSSTFESVGRKEMHEQRVEWESLVFEESDVDTTAIEAYLENLFKSSNPVTKAHEVLHRSTTSYCSTLRQSKDLFDVDTLKVTIQGLLATDLLSDEKSAILKTFSTNKEVLKEVADVLNMRFASLETWEWTTVNSAIFLEQRRQLNGKYRVYMDEDVLDALLIHALGMKWATFFKAEFTKFFNSFAWERSAGKIPTSDRERREWFLGDEHGVYDSVQNKRRDAYANDYFMTQLPLSEAEGARGYGDSDDENDLAKTGKNPLETKHSLLHLLVTETLVARHLRPFSRHAVLRSDFKWFGPSLPHATIFAALKFFGIDDFWLRFFRKFLEAPLRFTQDGPDSQIQVRKRGVPMSHALSDVLSEVVLFVMDFAVNSTTKSNLYRLHDDFWFWGSVELCRTGWHQMSVFASVMGLAFNEEKTGSVVFEAKADDSDDSDSTEPVVVDYEGLPKGEIRWGFLRLDAASARFEIDQSMVDDHIKELQLQLSHCRSIFSYTQAYNAYLARFFSNNFGKPAYAFGRNHVDMMIDTFVRIQKSMYPQSSVTDFLKGVAERRFSVKGIPDGIWYWPVKMGGLELRNPLVPLFGMRESLRRTPERMLEKALERDEAAYLVAKAQYEQINTGSGLGKYNTELRRKIKNSEEFMPKDEFLKYREARSTNLAQVYDQLLSVPDEKQVKETPEISAWLDTATDSSSSANICKYFNNMQPYWKWVVAVHGAEIVKKYGSVQIVDAGQVPLGVVSVMKAGKIRWKG